MSRNPRRSFSYVSFILPLNSRKIIENIILDLRVQGIASYGHQQVGRGRSRWSRIHFTFLQVNSGGLSCLSLSSPFCKMSLLGQCVD